MWNIPARLSALLGRRSQEAQVGAVDEGETTSAPPSQTDEAEAAAADEAYVSAMRRQFERQKLENRFEGAFHFRFDRSDLVDPLIENTLVTYARMFSFACLMQEQARQTTPSYSSSVVDRYLENCKTQFWTAHGVAGDLEYPVKERYTEYLERPATAS